MPGWARWWARGAPFGGWLADKLGGARVTLWNFVVMALAVVGVLSSCPAARGRPVRRLLPVFLVLFLTTGIGNGSTFRMIPVIFLTERMRGVNRNDGAAVAQATKEANTEAAAALGFTAAMAAYGGFFIPKSYGSSIALTGGPEAALYIFIAFYLICIAVTWWHYARRNAPMPC
jgi:NNP family nitrate/nitrite transporter-like MFS transporter